MLVFEQKRCSTFIFWSKSARFWLETDYSDRLLGVLLAAMVVLPYDQGAASRFGHIKAELERSGESVGDLDLQIASVALEFDVPLVTHNQRHFRRVPGLVVEDWLD